MVCRLSPHTQHCLVNNLDIEFLSPDLPKWWSLIYSLHPTVIPLSWGFQKGQKWAKMLPRVGGGGGSCNKKYTSAGKVGGKAGRRPGQLQTQEAQWTSVHHLHPHSLYRYTEMGEKAAIRSSLLLRGGAGSWLWHVESLGGRHEPQTEIWPREGKSNCRLGSSCLQPSWKCRSKGGWQQLGLGP